MLQVQVRKTNLRVVSDPSLHGASGIVMLNPEPNKRSQSAIILRNGTLNLHFQQKQSELTNIKTPAVVPNQKPKTSSKTKRLTETMKSERKKKKH